MERRPADIRALGSRNWPSPPWGGFQGTQDPRNLVYDPLMVLLSSGLMGPSPASGRGLLTGNGEFVFNHQYIQGKSFPVPLLVESRLLGETSITLDMQLTPPLWQKVKN